MIKFKEKLYDKFKISKLLEGKITSYVKTKCIQIKEKIFIIQKAYIHNILITFRMKNCALTIILMDEKKKLRVNILEEVDPIQYYSIVEKCLHLIHICSNIQFAISIVNQFMARSLQSSLLAPRRILYYIESIKDYEILYQNNTQINFLRYVEFN